MRILIEPNDVLMFREPKPFTAGEAHLARSVLPLPQAIAGALRSAILIKSNFSDDACEFVGVVKENRKIVEAKDPNFEILGCFPFKGEELFSTPLDIAKAKGIEGYFFVRPLKLWNGKYIFGGKHIHFESVEGFLSYSDLLKYLKGELNDEELENVVKSNAEVYCKESRIGIKLSDARVSEEGFLYKTEFLRLKENVKFSIWLGKGYNKLKDFLDEDIIRLGGEGRFARIKFENKNLLDMLVRAWDKIKEKINNSGRLKLYIATPTLINANNAYSWDIKDVLRSELKIEIKNIYPLIGKPLSFSGWDYAENRPKSTRYAIPAGSVYFIEFKGKIELDKPYIKLGENTKLGYGLCLLGVWE